jgi:hypothetical protein
VNNRADKPVDLLGGDRLLNPYTDPGRLTLWIGKS